MQAYLKIILRVADGRHINVEISGSQGGEINHQAPLPLTVSDLPVILRALEINRSVPETFNRTEWEQLNSWGVVAGQFKPGADDSMKLTEPDVDIDSLLKRVQQQLYETLFLSVEAKVALGTALNQVPANEALHIRLELPAEGSDNILLAQYPWEVLSYSSADLWGYKRVTFSRYVRFSQPAGEQHPVERLRVLVITARPKDLPAGLETDVAGIVTGLRRRLKQAPVRIRELPQATIEALSNYLFEHTEPHVLHFDGHGAFGRRCPQGHLSVSATAEQCPTCRARLPQAFSGYLAFEQDRGAVYWVSAAELADILLDHGLKLVVLNACNSGLGRRGETVFNGVAQSLIQRGIPAVVATSFRLDWEAAVQFATYFYQHVGQGESLVEAIDRTRQRLRSLVDTPREWYRPVLYLRQGGDGQGRLFDPQPRPEPDPENEPDRLIYIHTFEEIPRELPEKALNWGRYFDRETLPRLTPTPETWQRVLLPELRERREEIGDRGLIQVHSTGALTVGFAIGHTFQEVGKYRLEVAQSPPTPPQLWRSEATPPVGTDVEPRWSSKILPGQPDRTEAALIILAVPRRGLESVARAVGRYVGEAEIFEAFLTTVDYDEAVIEQLLVTGFSLEALRRLGAETPAFGRLPRSPEADAETLARQLIEFARRQLLEEELLDLIRQGNPGRYQRLAPRLRQVAQPSRRFKQVMFLQAEPAVTENRFMAGWEAAVLARESRRYVTDLVSQAGLQTLHLFLATPFGLAVFLGHQWNALNIEAQCYEWVGGAHHYAPACRLRLT